jgi:fucose permease
LIELKSDEKYSDLGSFNYFLNKRITYLYFFGIFAYVGVEQGINNWSSEFLNQYHNLDPNVVGVQVISSYWGNLTIGTLVSLFLIKFFSSRFLLKIYAISSSVLILIALFSSAEYSIFSFKLIGFTISGIWSVMIALGLNSIKEHHGMFSGILISGIVGGAIFPFLIALIGEFMGLKIGMLIIFLGLIYILFVGFVAKPLVSNKTIEMKSK